MNWQSPSPQAKELIRRGAEIVRAAPPEWLEELDTATLGARNMWTLAQDPELRESVRRSTMSNLVHWANANALEPGAPVPPNVSDELLQNARNLVRRGLDQSALDGYRAGQNAAWLRWMQIVFELTTDAAELREVLDITAQSISSFVDGTIQAVALEVRKERDELLHGTQAERRETVSLLIEGAPIALQVAESKLGYRLDREHTALIVWSEGANPLPEQLEAVAHTIATSWGANHRLAVVVSTGTLWVWVDASASGTIDVGESAPGIRVAVGSSGSGIEGFRRSHLEAVATQRILARLHPGPHAARFEDVQLVNLVTQDPAQADEFVAGTLGNLVSRDSEAREVLRIYLREQSSVARTAVRLHTHRNTVLRRLARAQSLLPAPLDTSALEVGVALDVLHWRG